MAVLDWLTLSFARGLGPVLIGRLVEALGSAEAACAATAGDLLALDGIGQGRAKALPAAIRKAKDEATRELDDCAALGVRVLCPDDDDWPVLLADTPDAPPVLWAWGELEPRDLNALAIVGSRRPSRYGQEQARRFATLLAQAGFTVVSGGAYGVDTHAHRGALLGTDGRTIAVLGCGVDVAYPPENEALFADIVDGRRGAILSELPLGTPVRKENFPRRNRIISGLSRGTLVVEAAERSGALITARVAAEEHGRPVFALPGQVDNPMSGGPHGLIRDGAILTTTLDDITGGLGPLPIAAYQPAAPHAEPAAPPSPVPAVSDTDRQILDALDGQTLGADELCDRADLPASVVQAALTLLSLKGLVRRVGGNRFERK